MATENGNEGAIQRQSNDREIYEDVLREQRELEILIRRVRHLFHAQHQAGTASAGRLLDVLDDLLEHLGMVFALKETDGYLDDLVESSPRFCDRAEALKSQHIDLFRALSRLIEKCDDDVRRRRWYDVWNRDERRFDRFCRQLLAHQGNEADFVQRALLEDVGVGD